MNGRDGTTAFLPLHSRIGGQGRNDRPTVGEFLTREQTRYIYRKVETGGIINTDTIEQEMEQEEQLSKMDDTVTHWKFGYFRKIGDIGKLGQYDLL